MLFRRHSMPIARTHPTQMLRTRRKLALRQRKSYGERSALIRLAGRVDCATMRMHDPPGDRQPKPRALLLFRLDGAAFRHTTPVRGFGPVERLEQVGQVFPRDANAAVMDYQRGNLVMTEQEMRHPMVYPRPLDRNLDSSTHRRVPNGIVHEHEHELLQAVAVSMHEE